MRANVGCKLRRVDDFISLDKKMENPPAAAGRESGAGRNWRVYLIVLSVASAIYLGCIVSPPSLMDDVDAVHAQMARNMLTSGDWVTARLDGVAYLEKAPLNYWLIAVSYKIFGVHDWAAVGAGGIVPPVHPRDVPGLIQGGEMDKSRPRHRRIVIHRLDPINAHSGGTVGQTSPRSDRPPLRFTRGPKPLPPRSHGAPRSPGTPPAERTA